MSRQMPITEGRENIRNARSQIPALQTLDLRLRVGSRENVTFLCNKMLWNCSPLYLEQHLAPLFLPLPVLVLGASHPHLRILHLLLQLFDFLVHGVALRHDERIFLHCRVPFFGEPLHILARLNSHCHGLINLLNGLVVLSLSLKFFNHVEMY